MKNICFSFIALIFVALLTSCAGISTHINLPEEPIISQQPQMYKNCILISRFGATTDADKELVPQILRVLPEVLRQQGGFAEVQLESDGKCESTLPSIIIKGVVCNSSNAAVPTPFMTTINFTHSSEIEFSVYDVSEVKPTKRFDENLQTSVYSFDVTSAKKLFSGLAKTRMKADYGAQADIPKLVSSVLKIAATDLSAQIGRQVYERIPANSGDTILNFSK